MILCVIPARFGSTRFPGKPLVEIEGKTMIRRVYEQALKASRVEACVVATDDERIFQHVKNFGGEVVMTSAAHPSGTDRCAEVARSFPKAKFVLNIQGDEPFVQPQQIDLLADTLAEARSARIATLAKKITSAEALFNPNVVKVVVSAGAEALYFSRQAIPFLRDVPENEWLERGNFFKHIGMYGFRREALLKVAKLAPSPLEKAESLEQLRWLENGFRIAVATTELETVSIDTPDDLLKIKQLN